MSHASNVLSPPSHPSFVLGQASSLQLPQALCHADLWCPRNSHLHRLCVGRQKAGLWFYRRKDAERNQNKAVLRARKLDGTPLRITPLRLRAELLSSEVNVRLFTCNEQQPNQLPVLARSKECGFFGDFAMGSLCKPSRQLSKK